MAKVWLTKKFGSKTNVHKTCVGKSSKYGPEIYILVGKEYNFNVSVTSSCASYPCGARSCTDLGGGNFQCGELSGDLTCSFEQHETQCGVMLDLNVAGDTHDPIYNTGKS